MAVPRRARSAVCLLALLAALLSQQRVLAANATDTSATSTAAGAPAAPTAASPSPPPPPAAPPADWKEMKLVLKLVGTPYPLSDEQAKGVADAIGTLTKPVSWTFRVQQASSPDQMPVTNQAYKVRESIPTAVATGTTAGASSSTTSSTTTTAAGRRLLAGSGRDLLEEPCVEDDFVVADVPTCGTECAARQAAAGAGASTEPQFYQQAGKVCCDCNLVTGGDASAAASPSPPAKPSPSPPPAKAPPTVPDAPDATVDDTTGAETSPVPSEFEDATTGSGDITASPDPFATSPDPLAADTTGTATGTGADTTTTTPPAVASPPPAVVSPPAPVMSPPPPPPQAASSMAPSTPTASNTWYSTDLLPVPLNTDGIYYFADAWMSQAQTQPVANQLIRAQGAVLTQTIRDGAGIDIKAAVLEYVGTGQLIFNARAPSTASDTSSSDGSGGLSSAAIAGIVVGVILGVAALAAVIGFVVMRKRSGSRPMITKNAGGSEETYGWRETYNRRLAESMQRAQETGMAPPPSSGKSSKSFGRSPSRSAGGYPPAPAPLSTEMAARPPLYNNSSGGGMAAPDLTRESANTGLVAGQPYSADVPENASSHSSKRSFFGRKKG